MTDRENTDLGRYRAAIEDGLAMLALFPSWNVSPQQIDNLYSILSRALGGDNE